MSDEPKNDSEIPRADGDAAERYRLTAAPDDTTDRSRSELFSVLANHHRRNVLRYLKQSGGPISVADLADELVRRETESSAAEIQEERQRLSLSLHHCHLPKLAESDLVSFDSDRKVVELSDYAEGISLDIARSDADERAREER